MHDELGNHAREEVSDQANSEAEASPVMAVLHHLETVALEVDLTIEVHLVEGLHGDLVLATVFETVGLLLEVKVVLDASVRESGLVSLPRADGGDNEPESSEKGQIDQNREEDKGLEATADLPFHVKRDNNEDGDEEDVAEGVGAGAVGWERGILDGGELASSARLFLRNMWQVAVGNRGDNLPRSS